MVLRWSQYQVTSLKCLGEERSREETIINPEPSEALAGMHQRFTQSKRSKAHEVARSWVKSRKLPRLPWVNSNAC